MSGVPGVPVSKRPGIALLCGTGGGVAEGRQMTGGAQRSERAVVLT